MSKSAQFRTRCTGSPAPRTLPDRPDAACLVSSSDRRSASSVRACVSVRVLLWAVCLASGTACPDVCAMQAVRVRWGGQGYTCGAYSRRPAPPGQPFNHRKNKKRLKNNPYPYCQSQKFRRKNKKTPTKVLCSVLYLPYKP